MTARREQHEGMPNRVLKAQAFPKMKDDTYRIKRAARCEKPQCRAGERGDDGPTKHHSAPTEEEVENNRHAVEAAWQRKFQHDAETAVIQTPASRPPEARLIFNCVMKGV